MKFLSVRPGIRAKRKFFIFLFVVLSLLAFTVRWQIITYPLDKLIAFVPDDSFYYLQIARNVVSGKGISFDGLSSATGFHPLWLALISVFCFIMPRATLVSFLKVILLLGTSLNIAAGIIFFAVAKKICRSRWVGMLLLLVFWFNPRQILSSVSGLETELSVFVFMLLIWTCFRFLDGHGRKKGDYLKIGIIASLLFLTRTDLIFYVFPVLLWTAIIVLRNKKIDNLMPLFLPSFLAFTLYLFWLYLTSGYWLPTSATAIPLVKISLGEGRLLSWEQMQSLTLFFIRDLTKILGIPFWLAPGLCFLLKKKLKGNEKWRWWLLFFLAGGGCFLFLSHVGIRQYPRPWYFDTYLPLF